MNRWLRWYQGTCDDSKLKLARTKALTAMRNSGNVVTSGRPTSGDIVAVWILILEGAADPDSEGRISHDPELIDTTYNFEQGESVYILAAFEAIGLLSRDDDGDLYVTNWNKRQFIGERKDNTRNERQRAFRKRQKEKELEQSNASNGENNASNAKSNASNGVTDTKSALSITPEQRQNRDRTETEEKTSSANAEPAAAPVSEILSPSPKAKSKKTGKPTADELKAIPIPDWLPEEVWVSWIDYRAETKKPMTRKAAEITLNDLGMAYGNGYDPQELVYKAIASGWQGCVFDSHLKAKSTPTQSLTKPGVPNGNYETKSARNQRYNEDLENFLTQSFEAKPEKAVAGERVFSQ